MITIEEIVKAEPRLEEFFNLDIKKLPPVLRSKVRFLTSRILDKCVFQATPDGTIVNILQSYVEVAGDLVEESKGEAL